MASTYSSYIIWLTCACITRANASRDLCRAGRVFYQFWSTRIAHIHEAALHSQRLHLNAGVLGVRLRLQRLLLGSRHLGNGATTRFVLDAW
jgi:hypothetical protein